MSKICIKCGMKLEDNALFCDECGTKQPDLNAVNETVPKSVNPTSQNPAFEQSASGVKAPQPVNQPADEMHNSGMGVAAFILGLVAICTFGALFIPEILGIVFAVITLKNPSEKKEYATAGLIMSIVSILWFTVIASIL